MDFSKYGYKPKARCESCVFYEYDEYTDSYCCELNLDEDDMGAVITGATKECPYYRYYDEYKSVHRQI